MSEPAESSGQVVLYRTDDGDMALDVRLDRETVWLTLNQMAELFERDKSVISRHLRTIFASGELDRGATVAKNATVQMEAGRSVERMVEYFSLDAILSVGYRVNSRRGTQFRIWATRTLRDYLVQGYALYEQRLRERGLTEMEQAIRLLASTLERNALVTHEGRAVLDVVRRYARAWVLLRQYDEDAFPGPGRGTTPERALDAATANAAIQSLRAGLLERGEAAPLFGLEAGGRLSAILGAVEQTFDGDPLYASAEEKAAHLLYFIIKDHPFSDGNKRIGSFLFVLYLRDNDLLERLDGTERFGDEALVGSCFACGGERPVTEGPHDPPHH